MDSERKAPELMNYTTDTRSRDLLTSLNAQRKAGHFCDVRLVVGDDVISAHRCVLSASSEYFRVLFLGDFGDCGTDECHMPTCEWSGLQAIVDYIYTGNIAITLRSVDGILAVTDYLCIADIKSFCSDFLKRHLGLTNCIQIKALTDRFSLDDIRVDVMDYLTPRMLQILESREIMDIPFTYVYPLLHDKQLNYIREPHLLEFIFRWINHAPAERGEHMAKLIHCVDFSYLGSEFIKLNIVNSKDISGVLLPEQRDTIYCKLSQQSFPSRHDDVIMCVSSPSGLGQSGVTRQGQSCVTSQLLVYIISEDKWYSVNSCPDTDLPGRVRYMCTHQNFLYLLVNKPIEQPQYRNHGTVDYNAGYSNELTSEVFRGRISENDNQNHIYNNNRIHYQSQTNKCNFQKETMLYQESDSCEQTDAHTDMTGDAGELWQVSLDKGSWTQLVSPQQLSSRSCVVPHRRGLYLIHPTGVVDKYDNMSSSWINYSGPGFSDTPGVTLRMIPVTTDRYIYLLRIFLEDSLMDRKNMDYSECSCENTERKYSLHRYDTERYSWTSLTQLQHDDHVSFHSCVFDTSVILLKDILGFDRVRYDIMTGRCMAQSREPSESAAAPRLLSEIRSSSWHEDTAYITGRIDQEPVFMLYSHKQARYKMLCQPPTAISGAFQHLVLPRTFRSMLSD